MGLPGMPPSAVQQAMAQAQALAAQPIWQQLLQRGLEEALKHWPDVIEKYGPNMLQSVAGLFAREPRNGQILWIAGSA
jgi:hypothetical protein